MIKIIVTVVVALSEDKQRDNHKWVTSPWSYWNLLQYKKQNTNISICYLESMLSVFTAIQKIFSSWEIKTDGTKQSVS